MRKSALRLFVKQRGVWQQVGYVNDISISDGRVSINMLHKSRRLWPWFLQRFFITPPVEESWRAVATNGSQFDFKARYVGIVDRTLTLYIRQRRVSEPSALWD